MWIVPLKIIKTQKLKKDNNCKSYAAFDEGLWVNITIFNRVIGQKRCKSLV